MAPCPLLETVVWHDLFLGRPRSRRYPKFKFNIRRDIPIKGNLDAAEEILMKAVEILGRADDWRLCMAVHFLRHIWPVRGKADEIVKYSKLEIEIGRRTNDEIVIAYGLYGFADGISRQGEFETSIKSCLEAIDVLEKCNGTFECVGYQELGRAQLQASDYVHARESLSRAVSLVLGLRFFESSAPSFPLLAEAILGNKWSGQPNSIAGKDRRKAARTAFVARLTGIVFPNNRPHAYRVSGRAAAANGKAKRAIKYFDRAIVAAEKTGARCEHARALIDKSVLAHTNARADRQRGLEILKGLGCVLPDAECEYLNIAKVSKSQTFSGAERKPTVLGNVGDQFFGFYGSFILKSSPPSK